MSLKDCVISFALACGIWFSFNFLFFSGSGTTSVESSFIAPAEKREYKPLNREVDFLDTKVNNASYQSQINSIETAWGLLQFSTDGASLESVDFKREINGSIKTIRALFPVAETEREKRCFLVGLDEKTPFYYSLVSHDKGLDVSTIIYAVENDDISLLKTFIIDNNRPKIDLIIDIAPKNNGNAAVTPRVFFPAPLMADIREADTISSIIIDQSGTFSKKRVDQLELNRGWFAPTLFGSDSRYFVYSLISDSDHFVQRAYYSLADRDRLFSVLEGPQVTQETSWKLSFYCGPKDLTVIESVDARLEKTLDYSGIFSLIAKCMLLIIKWLYSYVHNYGLAIILVTLLIQLILMPLSLRNGEEKFKQQQAVYQQKLAIIKHRFKDEPDKLAVEQAELMRTDGLPSFGCIIPLLIQIPLFFALSRVLSCSFELYQAPMLWIKDLSARDPYYILPVIVSLVMMISDGNKVDPQQRMNKIMMAVVFGAFTTTFSAGLTLYIAAGRIFGLIQSRMVKYFNMV